MLTATNILHIHDQLAQKYIQKKKKLGERQRNATMNGALNPFTAGVNCMIIKHGNSQEGEAKD